MRWSGAQGYRSDNPVGGAIGAALPRANGIKKHYRALPHAEVAGAIAIIWASLAQWATIAAIELLTLELLALGGQQAKTKEGRQRQDARERGARDPCASR